MKTKENFTITKGNSQMALKDHDLFIFIMLMGNSHLGMGNPN